MTEPEPTPEIVQQQSKTIDGTARSFFKGGMGIALNNLAKMSSLGHRNAERLMGKADARAGVGSNSVSDDMRIDSDDIHYHIQTPKPPSMIGSAMKIGAGALLAGTGVGAAFALPTIASGVMELLKPAAAVKPAEAKPETDAPTVTIGGQEYQLELGEPDEQ